MEGFIKFISPRVAILVASLSSLAILQGCSTQRYERVPASLAGTAMELDEGTVVAVRPVKIDGEITYIGPSTGAVVGSAVGQTAGDGTGQILAAAGGAAIGGIVGGMVEKQVTAKVAQEVTINVDNGETVVVVQELREPAFTEGDRVRVTRTRMGDARIAHTDYDQSEIY